MVVTLYAPLPELYLMLTIQSDWTDTDKRTWWGFASCGVTFRVNPV